VAMRTVVALVACAGVLAACSGGGSPVAQDSASPGRSSPSAGALPSVSALPEPTASALPTSPLSGRPADAESPVMVVKLDNTLYAQPHQNLVAADIVYVEPVEWGLTRLAAVYSSRMPKVVGPVRSARISDIEVFAPLGNAAFVYSGAQTRLQPRLTAARWTPVSEDLDSAGFHRDYSRPAPYNLMAEPRVILDSVGPVDAAPDVGFVFDADRQPGGSRAKVVTAGWPHAAVQFRWRAKNAAYDVWMNGQQARDTSAPGVQRATSVIVQYVEEVDSGYGDKFGGRTPKSITVGSGKGLLLRDGRAHRITWQRDSARQPTTYLDADGEPIVLSPGQVWILLKDRTRKVTID